MKNRLINKYFHIIYAFILIVITLNSCHIVKQTITGRKAISGDESILKKVINTEPDGKFIEIRLTGKGEEDKNRVGFIGTVKIEKDRQLYIVLRTTIGIELARVYANRDSIWITSKMLNIKEKGNWKLAGRKIGFPVDYCAIEGILLQSLFTSSGDQLKDLLENLVVKSDKDSLRLVSNTDVNHEDRAMDYTTDFSINRETYFIQDLKIRDVKGQWLADVRYSYNKENLIKKIDMTGIDSERDFAVEINVVKREIKDFIEINFAKF